MSDARAPVPEWIADGHTVALLLSESGMEWVWRCPWSDTTRSDWHQRPDDEVPPCRRGYSLRGILIEHAVSPECLVAPWFHNGNVLRCLFLGGGTHVPTSNPIVAEYAWFGGHFRWRPAGTEAAA